MRNFRNWEIWKKSRKLVRETYLISTELPDTEKFGLVSQMRRAAVSIPANIAEGAGRKSEKELRHFLHNAIGSAFELETLIALAGDLNFITEKQVSGFQKDLDEILRMINGFISKLS